MHSLLFIGLIFSKSSVPMPAQIFSVDIHDGAASASSPVAQVHHHNSSPQTQHTRKSAQAISKDATHNMDSLGLSDRDKPDDKKASSSSESSNPSGNEHSANALSIYSSQVTQILNQKKIYPKISIDREEEDTVIVNVKLAATGTIEDVEIIKPAIFDRLNSAALQTIRTIPHFPPPPLSTGSTDFMMQIPLTYKIERH